MKHSISTAALSLTSILIATGSAAAQVPYNRGITGIEVRPSQQHGQGFYDLTVGLVFHMTDAAPFDPNHRLDLSTSLEVFVDGVFWSSGDVPVMASNGDNDYPSCDQWQPCDEGCGITMVGADSFSNQCLPPYINGGTGPCMCTSYADIVLPDIYVPPGAPGVITIEVAAGPQQLAEVFLDDDRLTMPLVGANYCVANPNSTGEPAKIRGVGSRSVQANDLTLVASPLPTNQFGIFYYGPSAIQAPFGDGYRCVGGQSFRLPVTSAGPEGVLSTQLDLTNPVEPGALIQAGSTHYFQAWYRDPSGGPIGFNLSDGFVIEFLP